LVFYNSILTYDLEQHEVEFGLFAKICIYNALVSQLRILKKRSEEPVEEIPEGLLSLSYADDPALKILEQERIKKLYEVIRKNLSGFEYTVWQLYVSGRSSADIAALLDSNKRAIDNAIYRIRKKLKELLK
jgi:RNA polymerase sporulation-specific sigma factor